MWKDNFVFIVIKWKDVVGCVCGVFIGVIDGLVVFVDGLIVVIVVVIIGVYVGVFGIWCRI